MKIQTMSVLTLALGLACSSGGSDSKDPNIEPSDSAMSSENGGPSPVTDEELLTMFAPGETPENVPALPDDVVPSSDDPESPRRIDPFTDELGADFTDAEGNPVEPPKGYETEKRFDLVQGLGWSLYGVLAFQDGQPGAFGSDHCTRFGKTCDNIWHAQLGFTGPYSTFANFEDQIWNSGACGSAVIDSATAQSSMWMPCMVPKFNKDLSRTIKWKFYTAGCNQNSTKLGHMRNAIINAMSAMASNFGFTVTEVTGGANVQFLCTDLSSPTLGRFYPTGNMALEVGSPVLPLPGHPFPDPTETCAQPGYPGSSPAYSTHYATDMIYSVNNFNVELDDTDIFSFLGSCTSDGTLLRRAISNIVKHEMGHVLGLHHTPWNDPVYGLMRESQSCTSYTNNSEGFIDLMRNAINDANYGTPGATSDIYKDDLACFKQTGY